MSFATAGMTASREVQLQEPQERQQFSNVGLVDYRQNFNTPSQNDQNTRGMYMAKNTPKQPEAWMGFSETKTGRSTRAARDAHVDIDQMAKAISSDFFQNLQSSRSLKSDDSINVKFANEVVNELQSHMERQNRLEQMQKRSDSRLAGIESNIEYLTSSVVDNDIEQRLQSMEKRIISNVDTKLKKQMQDLKPSSSVTSPAQHRSLEKIQQTVKQLEANMSLKADKEFVNKQHNKLSAELHETQKATLSIGDKVQALKTASSQPTPKSKARDFIRAW